MTSGAVARPTGITILAILSIIGGVFGLIGGLGLIAGGALLGGAVGGTTGAALGGMAFVFGIVTLGFAVAYIAFAYGAWTLKPWGWMLGVIMALASLVWTAIGILLSGNIMGNLLSVSTIISVAIPLIILYYLNTPVVKSAFGRA
ncbi:MAG TPA: hypothetical protein VJZ72_11910 [Candidatus Limnocylindrales bacterium]|nr:hypothetical protein [Candidatus Limnocylindrales bacterium]